MRILLVEDEERAAGFLAKGLREQSYAVDVSGDGDDALYQAAVNHYDVVILDVMLPRRNGYAVCRELRSGDFRAPILMLTARDSVDDRVAGLDCGADDYLIKPFDFKELLARLRALLRRREVPLPRVLTVGGVAIDTASHTVTRSGSPVNLTAKEYALLEFLVLHADRVVGREAIAEHVWDDSFDPLTNVIDVYIKRLRAKLEDDGPRLIHTRRGEGYILTANENRATTSDRGRDREGEPQGRDTATEGDESTSPDRSRAREEAAEAAERFAASEGCTFRGAKMFPMGHRQR